MHTETHEAETESGGRVDFNAAIGYSGLYAMVLAMAAFTNTAIDGDVMVDTSLAMGYFIPIFAAVFLLNVAARASGLADLVASRMDRPIRLNLLLSIVVGIWVLLR